MPTSLECSQQLAPLPFLLQWLWGRKERSLENLCCRLEAHYKAHCPRGFYAKWGDNGACLRPLHYPACPTQQSQWASTFSSSQSKGEKSHNIHKKHENPPLSKSGNNTLLSVKPTQTPLRCTLLFLRFSEKASVWLDDIIWFMRWGHSIIEQWPESFHRIKGAAVELLNGKILSLTAGNMNAEKLNVIMKPLWGVCWSSLANQHSLDEGPQTPHRQWKDRGKHILHGWYNVVLLILGLSHIIYYVWCYKQKVILDKMIFVGVFFFYVYGGTHMILDEWDKPILKWHIFNTDRRTHKTHRGGVVFQIQPTSLVTTTFEFNLHLTSTLVFLTALYRGDQGHCVCFLAPRALKPSLLCSGRLKVSSVLFKWHAASPGASFLSLLSPSLRPPLLHIIFEDNCRLEDKNPGCGACRHFLLGPDLNKELWN